MSIEAGDTRIQGPILVQADASKIERHPLTPNKLELTLLKSDEGDFSVEFGLIFKEGELHPFKFQNSVYGKVSLGRISKPAALQKYEEYTTKIREGKYKLYLSDDGKLAVEIL